MSNNYRLLLLPVEQRHIDEGKHLCNQLADEEGWYLNTQFQVRKDDKNKNK